MNYKFIYTILYALHTIKQVFFTYYKKVILNTKTKNSL